MEHDPHSKSSPCGAALLEAGFVDWVRLDDGHRSQDSLVDGPVFPGLEPHSRKVAVGPLVESIPVLNMLLGITAIS